MAETQEALPTGATYRPQGAVSSSAEASIPTGATYKPSNIDISSAAAEFGERPESATTSPFPLTLQPGESYNQLLGRVIEYGAKNPDDFQRQINQSQVTAGKMARESAPTFGAMAATALAPEGAPWYWSMLMRMGLAGMGGAAGAATADIATGQSSTDKSIPQDILRSGVEQSLYETGGQAISGSSKWLSNWAKMANGGIVPQETIDYLKSKGIHLTTGERIGPGFVSAAENVVGSTAIGSGVAAKLGKSRQINLVNEADKLASSLAPEDMFFGTTNGESIPGIQSAAKTALTNSTLGSQMAVNRLTPSTITPADAGNVILSAVRGQFDASQLLEKAAYNNILPEIEAQGITVDPVNTTEKAADYLAQAKKVSTVLGKVPEAERPIMDSLRALSGEGIKDQVTDQLFNGLTYDSLDPARRRIVDQTVADAGPIHPDFNTFWQARQEFGSRIGQLEASGAIDNKKLRVLNDIYKSMSDDMLSSLPADLRSGFESATNITKEQKEIFGQHLIKSMLHPDKPMAAEKVISTLLTSGNESDVKALVNLVGNDPAARTALSNATSDWMTKNFTSSQQMLKMLDNRPGLKLMLGDGNFNLLRNTIADRAAAEITPEEKAYRQFLGSVFKGKSSDDVIRSAATSPVYSAALDRLTTANNPLRDKIASDLMGHLMDTATEGAYGLPGAKLDGAKLLENITGSREALSHFIPSATLDNLTQFAKDTAAHDGFNDILAKSTHGGSFGDPQAIFDPKKFSALWSEARPQLSRIMDPQTLNGIDKFAKGTSYMTFAPGSNVVAGKIGTLRQMAFLMGGASWLLQGTPISGILAGASLNLGPRAILKFTTSPMGSKLLSEGIRLPSASPEASANIIKSIALLHSVNNQESANGR